MSRQELVKISEIKELARDIFLMRIESASIARKSKCGQFVNIKCSDGNGLSLRRPISICDVNKNENTVDIVFQAKGKGTKLLAKKKTGDILDVMGPLGNGIFTVDNFNKIAVVGGGIGIFPLLYLLRSLEGKCNNRTAILGFRNKDAVVLEKEFAGMSENLIVCTDDGSYGKKGFTTDVLKDLVDEGFDMIYTCGPMPMLSKVSKIAKSHNIPCEVSVEQRMGCGIGACLVCACKTKDPDAEDGWSYSHVCKDGPVFKSEEVIFND